MRWSIGLIGLIGCADKGEDPGGSTDPEGGDPDVAVSLAAVDFGDVDLSPGLSLTESVEIANAGSGDLTIESVTLANGTASAFALSAPGSEVLAPGETTTLVVTYAPDAVGSSEGLLLIGSDDPDEAAVSLAISAAAHGAILEIGPPNPDLSGVYVGCEPEASIRLGNAGDADLVIDEVSLGAASSDIAFDADIDGNGPLPWTLPPGEGRDVSVTYAPLDDSDASASLTVISNDALSPVTELPLAAQGALYGESTDAWDVPAEPRAVVLFAVDFTTAADIRPRLQQEMVALAEAMDAAGVDFRIAAAAQDSGEICGSADYIDGSNVADAAAIAADMLGLGSAPCAAGDNATRAFMLMEAALSANNSWITNESGWDESMLHLVGVSDEIEQSPGTWLSYVEDFQALRNNPDDVVFHAIGGDYPTGCDGNEPYIGMFEAVSYTGGIFLSICAADWGESLQELAEIVIAGDDLFDLTDWPVPDTIAVAVDGILQTPERWSYIDVENAVLFEDAHKPAGGSRVEISYAHQPECNY